MKAILLFLVLCWTSLVSSQSPTFNGYPFCITNSSCTIPAGQSKDNICCGHVEYERNGAALQTITRCMRVNEFQKVLDEFVTVPTVAEVAMGCVVYDPDEGVIIGKYPFPEE